VISGLCCDVNEIFVLLGGLHSLDWWLVSYVSGQPIGAIFKGQAGIIPVQLD